MTEPGKRQLDRVRYWQGQMLRSADFGDIQGAEAQRRWWHNRALHNAYGVYDGLEILESKSLAGLLEGMRVQPGIAYDCFGRELILERAQNEPLPVDPPPNAAVFLVIRYAAPSPDLPPTGVCWTRNGSIYPGTVEFLWKAKDAFRVTDGVPIAEMDYKNGQPALVADFAPVTARALARPVIETSSTLPGRTPWGPWEVSIAAVAPGHEVIAARTGVIGVQTTIDTSAAGFTDVPCYFAWLDGPIFNSQTRQFLSPLPSIANESINSFAFRLLFPYVERLMGTAPEPRILAFARPSAIQLATEFRDLFGDFAAFAQQQNLYVSWVGCQMTR